MKKLILFLTIAVFFCCGCERNPAGALIYNGIYDSDPATWSNPFILYRNGDIRTLVLPFDNAIGAYTNIWEEYASPVNVLEAQFSGVSHSGHKSIKMGWSGESSQTYGTTTTPPQTVNNVAFWLTTTNSGSTKELSAGGYTKFSFWCRTSLASDTEAVINVFGHGYPSRDIEITGNTGWTYYEVDISAYNTMIDTYISVTMQPIGGGSVCGGGTLFLDDIRLSK